MIYYLVASYLACRLLFIQVFTIILLLDLGHIYVHVQNLILSMLAFKELVMVLHLKT